MLACQYMKFGSIHKIILLIYRICTVQNRCTVSLCVPLSLMSLLRVCMRKYHDHEKYLSWDFDWFTSFQQSSILKGGLQLRIMYGMYREDFYSLHEFTVLGFTATGASPAERRMRILPDGQWHSEWSSHNLQITWGVENAFFFICWYFCN
jgi:hypothetical protein